MGSDKNPDKNRFDNCIFSPENAALVAFDSPWLHSDTAIRTQGWQKCRRKTELPQPSRLGQSAFFWLYFAARSQSAWSLLGRWSAISFLSA
jgi:hypothetical protein